MPIARSHIVALLVCSAALSFGEENEVGFVDKFALAPDRAAVLAELTPGTEDYYFFSALHFQNTRETAKLKETLAQWAKRFPESAQRETIENREALLDYDANPQATLKFLRARLEPDLTHERETQAAPPDLPTVLDAKAIARSVFEQQALEEDDLGQCSEAVLETLVTVRAKLRPEQARALLGRIRRPDIAELAELIAADLESDASGGFGEFAIHKLLLPEQLDELAKRIPDLRESEAWIAARLATLAPDADLVSSGNSVTGVPPVGSDGLPEEPVTDRQDARPTFPARRQDASSTSSPLPAGEREAWLDRAWAFVKTLSASSDALKLDVLRERLEFDRQRAARDRARFVEFLKLKRGHAPDSEPPERIDDRDEPLVRDYLLHFLKDEPKWEPWVQWLRDTLVKPIFAEAKIVNGIGDPEQWAPLLDPEEFEALRDRVDRDRTERQGRKTERRRRTRGGGGIALVEREWHRQNAGDQHWAPRANRRQLRLRVARQEWRAARESRGQIHFHAPRFHRRHRENAAH